MTPKEIARKVQQLRNDGNSEFADYIETVLGQNANLKHVFVVRQAEFTDFRQVVADAMAAVRAEIQVALTENLEDLTAHTLRKQIIGRLDAEVAKLSLPDPDVKAEAAWRAIQEKL